MTWVRLCSLRELEDGKPKGFNVRGRDLVALRVGSMVYVCDRWCTHEQGDMGMGWVEGTVITCPDHGSQFDLAKGGKNVLGPDGEPAGSVADLHVFDVRVEGAEVNVDI